MSIAERGAQFVISCLVLGMGLFVSAWGYHAAVVVQDRYRSPLLDAIGVRSLAVLGGVLLMAVGAYGAWAAIPL